MVSPIIVALVVVVFFTCIYYLIPPKFKQIDDVINKIPGPKGYPIVGHSTMIGLATDRQRELLLMGWIQQFPGIFKLWLGPMPTIVVCSPEIAGEIFRSTKHISKGVSYNFLHEWLGTGLLTSTGDKWKTRRRLITPSFHFDVLRSFVETFREQTNILIKLLDSQTNTEKSFDIFPFVTRCALDIICNSAMGQSVDAQSHPTNDYVQAVFSLTRQTFERTLRPWEWNDFLFKSIFPSGRSYNKNLNILKSFGKSVIKNRRQVLSQQTETKSEDSETKTREAFLDMLLRAEDENHQGLSDEDILEEVETFMFEGHDTTSAGVAWALWNIGQHPEVQKKIQDELDHALGSRIIPTFEDLDELHYLELTIKESLRLNPSVPIIARIAEEDMILGGCAVPKGTQIGIVVIALHRLPSHWGPDADKFRPERFLDEESHERNSFAYVPFSAGSRNCIGQRFAMMEEKVILSGILKNYEVETDMSIDPDMRAELILRPGNGINVKLRKRNLAAS